MYAPVRLLSALTGLCGLVFFPAFGQNVSVRLQLDLRQQILSPDGVHVAGDFQSLIGPGGNWDPSTTALSDADGDSIFDITLMLPPGSYRYKFINGDDWGDTHDQLTPECGQYEGGVVNRWMVVGSEGLDQPPVRIGECVGYTVFEVDLSGASPNPNGVFVSGDFLDEAGLGSDFQFGLPLEARGGGRFWAPAYLSGTGTVLYRFHNGDGPGSAESVPSECAVGGNYRSLQTQSAPRRLTHCFADCSNCLFDTDFDTYWWNDVIFYEIFVRSFKDSDGNGRGDFRGLIDKLDYLNDGDPNTTTDLGITGIWLMPINPSPSYHGYDVTDYQGIESDYGSMADFEAFLDSAHARGIKVIMDFVMNHSSSQHPWFLGAQSNPNHPDRNRYRWSSFNPGYQGPWGQTVWHQAGGSWYYGLFWGGMPDLNYDHPPVKTDIFNALTFWQSKGIDGFRLDAIKYLDEDGSVLENTPETFQLLRDYNDHVKGNDPECFTVGEVWSTTSNVVPYVDSTLLDVCFEFDLAGAVLGAVNGGSAPTFLGTFENVIQSYPTLQIAPFLTNHDQTRAFEVLGSDWVKMKQAAALYLALPGAPFLYYGEEIGMVGSGPDENKRTPMQWTSGLYAGFSTVSPWRSVNSDYPQKNVVAQSNDPSSLLNTYRTLIHARNSSIALRQGYPLAVQGSDSETGGLIRIHEDEAVLVAANFGHATRSGMQFTLPISSLEPGTYVATNLLSGASLGQIQVDAQGGLVYAPTGSMAAHETRWIRLIDSASIGLEEQSTVFRPVLAPNPARDQVRLLGLDAKLGCRLGVFSTSGQTALQMDLKPGQNEFSVAQLAKGIYFIRIEQNATGRVLRLVIE
ncbi:T9SS type A sorting domain-containing protein [bacterium]|nr:T9SS type A sorting domain-containing protein [bacterium]